jgi:mono/diheme cytochrome c family protein
MQRLQVVKKKNEMPCLRMFAVVTLLFLSTLYACERKPPPGVTDPGHLLYLGFGKEDVDCSRCHGLDGQGGWKGPDIRNAFAESDSAKIVRIIKKGKGGDDKMPGFGDLLTDDEIRLIIRHMRTMTPDSP